jgi:hypothetical protein
LRPKGCREALVRGGFGIGIEAIGLPFHDPDLTDELVRRLGVGAGTEDAVIVMRGVDSLDIYASPHTIKTYADATSGTAKTAINVVRYVAFTAARLPASIGELTGTGLIAP